MLRKIMLYLCLACAGCDDGSVEGNDMEPPEVPGEDAPVASPQPKPSWLQRIVMPDELEILGPERVSRTAAAINVGWRSGEAAVPHCYVQTPWLSVPAPSEVMLFPGFVLRTHYLKPFRNPVEHVVTRFEVDARTPDGRITPTIIELGTDAIPRDIFARSEDGTELLYMAELETRLGQRSPLVYHLGVDQPSELRIKMCGIDGDTELEIQNIAMLALPRP